MPLGYLFELPGMTQQQYDAIMQQLQLAAPNTVWPQGIIAHVAGPMEGGWRVVDVWESQEAAEAFFAGRLAQAAQAAGIAPPQPQVFPVHNVRTFGR